MDDAVPLSICQSMCSRVCLYVFVYYAIEDAADPVQIKLSQTFHNEENRIIDSLSGPDQIISIVLIRYINNQLQKMTSIANF